MDGKTIIISPKRFLNHFLHLSTTNGPPELPNLFGSFKVDEQNIRDRLMITLNDAPDLCPGFQFAVTAAGPEQDIVCGLYAAGHVPVDKARANTTNAQPNPISRNDDAADCERCAKGEYPTVDWSRLELPIIVTTEASADPYNQSACDSETETDNDLQGRKRVIRSIEACAQSVFDCQPRTPLYMILIISDTARLIYIDRAGVVVTTAFNCRTNEIPIVGSLRRFARPTAAQRGHDSTFQRLDPKSAEAEKTRQRAKTSTPDDYATTLFAESLDSDWPWYCLTLISG
ncbi:hypothetical protein C8Q77DRAFT_1161704 [Trametes polyzona]|nr:hypothetical protein C8Q77DRAFT_1161704 [Trametes polyzona]